MTKIDPSIMIDVDNEEEMERFTSSSMKPCKLSYLDSKSCFVVHSGGVVNSIISRVWSLSFQKWVGLVIKTLGKEKCKNVEWPGFMSWSSTDSPLDDKNFSVDEEEVTFAEEIFDFQLNYDLDFPGKELLDPVTLDELMRTHDIIEG